MWLIGQQPILDRDERITAYELLFRSPGDDRANIIDSSGRDGSLSRSAPRSLWYGVASSSGSGVGSFLSPLEPISPAIRHLRQHPVRLLAEKVETRQQFRDCHDLGFHLFQGYYFARPVTIKHRRIDDGGATLLTLLRLLMDDADIRKIEEAFRSSPGLTLNLLMLVNSVGFGVPRPPYAPPSWTSWRAITRRWADVSKALLERGVPLRRTAALG